MIQRAKEILVKILRHKKNLLAVSLGQVIAAFGTLIGVRLLTEFISPGVFGEYKLLLAAISLMTGIFIRPFTQFIMREYHDAENVGLVAQFLRYTKALFRNYIFWVAILFAIIIKFSAAELVTVSNSLLLLLPLTLMLQTSVELERALMVTQNRQVQASLVSIGCNWLIPLVIVFITALFSQSVDMMIVSTIIVLVCIYLIQKQATLANVFRESTKSVNDYTGGIRHEAVKYGLPLAAVGLLSWLVHESDRFFLAYYQSQEVVGIYSAAYGLVSAPFTLVVGSMAQFLYPIMFRVSASGNKKGRMKVLKAMLITSSAICTIGVLIVGLFDDQIAWLALGENYREGATRLLVWIATGYGFMAIAMSFDLAAYGRKRTSDMLIAYGVSALTNVSLNLLLIPEHGAMGAVIATLVSLVLYLVSMVLLFLYREVHLGINEVAA
jgi:O-antigen/teichoic acid export membrane protein